MNGPRYLPLLSALRQSQSDVLCGKLSGDGQGRLRLYISFGLPSMTDIKDALLNFICHSVVLTRVIYHK